MSEETKKAVTPDQFERLNAELNGTLDSLEAETATALEKQRRNPEVESEKEKLRTEYSEKVAPMLKNLSACQKKVGPTVARCAKYLENTELHIRAGINRDRLQPPVITLKELRVRIVNIPAQLERIPGRIDAGPIKGETLSNWAALIRADMRPGPGLIADIEAHHERLAYQIGEIKNARRWPTQSTSIHRAGKPELPPEVKTTSADFQVFGDPS